MKKNWLFICLALLLIALTSCHSRLTLLRAVLDERGYSLQTAERIVQMAIEDDTNAMMDFLSDSVLDQCENVQADCDVFLATIRGDLIAVKCNTAGPQTSISRDSGKMSYEYTEAVVVESTEDIYMLVFTECLLDEFNRDNEGLLYAWVIREEDWDGEYKNWGSGLHTGPESK